ncbi:hypothetical protein ACTWP6_14840 [Mycobacterium sp. 4D054]|uniref:hypothetical protein n=1 Tax=Mycobacterium sp. 4D054 TaxID=3457440 RepID=UPI003FCF466F
MRDVVKRPISPRNRILAMLFVGIQILVPAGFLGLRWVKEGSQPTTEFPFSWQMYSRASSIEYFGIDDAGEEIALSTEGLIPVLRGVAYDYSVPAMLCDANPELVAVQRRADDPELDDFTEFVSC